MAPQTRLQKSFVATLTAPKQHEISIKDFLDLRQNFLLLQKENLKFRLQALEERLANMEKEGIKIKEYVIKDETMVKDIVEIQEKIQEKIQCEMEKQLEEEFEEQRKRHVNSLKLRVGGLSPSCFSSMDYEATFAKIKEATSPIDWYDIKVPNFQKVKGSCSAILTFYNKTDRLDILRQTSKLKGTKLWIAEELTLNQPKQKPTELRKVKEAREAGKWAVYREGRAIIRDFTRKGSQP